MTNTHDNPTRMATHQTEEHRDARHKKCRVLGNQLALKDLKLILDQGEDAIARGDKLIHRWWGRLIRSTDSLERPQLGHGHLCPNEHQR